MAFLCPIPSIFVEAILTCESGTDLAPEIYDILNPSPGLLGWNLQWSNQRLYILYIELERQQFLFTIKIILHPYPHSLYASSKYSQALSLILFFRGSPKGEFPDIPIGIGEKEPAFIRLSLD